MHRPWSVLKTQGICIGAVEIISEVAQADQTFARLEKGYFSTIQRSFESSKREMHPHLAMVSRLVGEYCRFWEAADRTTFQFEAGTTARMLDTERDETIISHISTLLCGRISTTGRITDKDIEAILSGRATSPPTAGVIDHSFLDKVCTSFIAGLRRRRLFFTADTAMGAGPDQSQEGDLICVLFGCSVPVILRKREEGAGGGYRFIGECYVHNFMDAEALVMEVKGKRKVDEFLLR